MEKAKLTKEQAEALDELFEKTTWSKDEMIDLHAAGTKWGPYRSLNELSVSELAKALYVGYEVEPEFEYNDWVYQEATNTIARIKGFNSEDNRVYIDHDEVISVHTSTIRHATPAEIAEEKERRFFAKHGRKPWELKPGDVLHDEKEGYTGTVEKIIALKTDNEIICFTDGEWEYANNVPEQFKVVCFVEDRKDVKVNE